VCSALFGIGGGALAIPLLSGLYPELLPQHLVTTSFAFILLNATTNIIIFKRRGFILDIKLALTIAVGVGLGTPIGSLLLVQLEARTFELIFGSMLVILGLKNQLSRRPEHTANSSDPKMARSGVIGFLRLIIGMGIGLIAGLTGIGGGTLILPLLLATTNLPLTRLSYHSHVIMLMAASTGLLMALSTSVPQELALTYQGQLGVIAGPILLGPLCFLALGSILSARFGAHLLLRLPLSKLRLLFSIFLFFVGARFLFP
jgi:uncharacterized protein